MKKTIFLARHAHIDTQGAMIGRLDFPLSPQGIAEAYTLKNEICDALLKDSKKNHQTLTLPLEKYFQNIYVSPLLRTRQTADIILKKAHSAKNLSQETSYTLAPQLIEISLGVWEGMTKQEIKKKFPEIWQKRGEDFANTAPPQGESFAQVEKRVLPFFYRVLDDMLQKKDENNAQNLPILIIAHQAVNRVILAKIHNIPLAHIQSIPQEYACLQVLEIE